MAIVAAADGSSLGNPGAMGWAWYVDDNTWQAGGAKRGTNNIGELTAVLELFKATKHRAEEPLQILCDSQYVINCVTKWMPGWKKRGWVKADKKPVLNVDLLKQIDAELVGRTYSFEWVRGHAGHPLNEAADERARAAATSYQNGSAPDEGPGFPGAGNSQSSTTAQRGSSSAAHNEAVAASQDSESDVPASASASAIEQSAEQDDQMDLLSLLSDDDPEETQASQAAESVVDAVWKLERELLNAYVEASAMDNEPDIVHLLDEMFTGVRADGVLVEDSSTPMTPVQNSSMERLDGVELLSNVVRLNYVLDARRDSGFGELVVGSTWLQRGKSWKLAFRQETGRN